MARKLPVNTRIPIEVNRQLSTLTQWAQQDEGRLSVLEAGQAGQTAAGQTGSASNSFGRQQANLLQSLSANAVQLVPTPALLTSPGKPGQVAVDPSGDFWYCYAFNKWAKASGGGGGSGTVTSVALTMPAGFTVTGSPITTAGTIVVTGGPSGGGALVQLDQTTLGSNAATVAFSSISQSYTNLLLTMNLRSASTSDIGSLYIDYAWIQVNGDTGTVYDQVYTRSSSGSTSGGYTTGVAKPGFGLATNAHASSGFIGINSFVFADYSGSTWIKTATGSSGAGGVNSILTYNWYWDYFGSTNAITSMLIGLVSGADFVAGSQFTLYGMQ
jgi:hypothetical protein